MRRKLAAGNWKMNGSFAGLDVLLTLKEAHQDCRVDIVICPPALFIGPALVNSTSSSIQIGAQDCHAEDKGAFTGDISAGMIAESGATYIIVGHSERRDAYGETDTQVAAKAKAALKSGLNAIVCIGESLAEREEGKALDVISRQLSASVPDGADCKHLVVAYEPIWAIGTGKIPSMEQIEEVHCAMRAQLRDRFGEAAEDIRLLYGGSVKPANASDIFALKDVDGALVGGASLSADDFSPIISALEGHS